LQATEDLQAATQAQDIRKQIALQAAIKFNGGGASLSPVSVSRPRGDLPRFFFRPDTLLTPPSLSLLYRNCALVDRPHQPRV